MSNQQHESPKKTTTEKQQSMDSIVTKTDQTNSNKQTTVNQKKLSPLKHSIDKNKIINGKHNISSKDNETRIVKNIEGQNEISQNGLILKNTISSKVDQPSSSSQPDEKKQSNEKKQVDEKKPSENLIIKRFKHYFKSIDEYKKLDKLGEGTYGEVFKAKHTDTGQIVAVKKIKLDREKEGFPLTAIREIIILKSLRHNNIVKLIDVFASKDLAGLIDAKVTFTEANLKSFMQQLLEALDYIHSRKILHRDIKASNLLINRDGILKLADFGLSRFSIKGKGQYTGGNRVITRWYRPPELLLGATAYGPAVDMWSVGCILGEMLTGKALLPGKNELEQLDLIFQLCGTPTKETWPGAIEYKDYSKMAPKTFYKRTLREKLKNCIPAAVDLLDKILVLDPSKRPTARECLNHEWLQKPPKPELPSNLPIQNCNELSVRIRRKRARRPPPQQQQRIDEPPTKRMKPPYETRSIPPNIPPPPPPQQPPRGSYDRMIPSSTSTSTTTSRQMDKGKERMSDSRGGDVHTRVEYSREERSRYYDSSRRDGSRYRETYHRSYRSYDDRYSSRRYSDDIMRQKRHSDIPRGGGGSSGGGDGRGSYDRRYGRHYPPRGPPRRDDRRMDPRGRMSDRMSDRIGDRMGEDRSRIEDRSRTSDRMVEDRSRPSDRMGDRMSDREDIRGDDSTRSRHHQTRPSPKPTSKSTSKPTPPHPSHHTNPSSSHHGAPNHTNPHHHSTHHTNPNHHTNASRSSHSFHQNNKPTGSSSKAIK